MFADKKDWGERLYSICARLFQKKVFTPGSDRSSAASPTKGVTAPWVKVLLKKRERKGTSKEVAQAAFHSFFSFLIEKCHEWSWSCIAGARSYSAVYAISHKWEKPPFFIWFMNLHFHFAFFGFFVNIPLYIFSLGSWNERSRSKPVLLKTLRNPLVLPTLL